MPILLRSSGQNNLYTNQKVNIQNELFFIQTCLIYVNNKL